MEIKYPGPVHGDYASSGGLLSEHKTHPFWAADAKSTPC